MRIRSRLLLLVVAVLLPVLVSWALGGTYIYREQQAFQRASMRETARALSLALDREMARRETLLRALAASPSLANNELERFHRYAREVAAQGDDAIILSDLEGRQLLNTRRPFGAPLPSMLPAERRERALYGNEATLTSDVYVPPAGLGPVSFAIQVPVRRDGQVVQFLTLASYVSQLQRLLDEQRLPQGWHATIIDRQGRVAARSSQAERFVGRPVRQELIDRIKAADEGFHEGTSLAGVSATAVFSRSPTSRWTFLVAVPNAELYGAVVQGAAWLGGASLLLLLLGVAAAVALGRRIAGPIESLSRAAERLGRHEPVEMRPTGMAEVDAVQRSLVNASSQLRQINAELERRVAEAVASYEQSQRALVQAQKLEALGRLTGGIAHDFNNVLQTLTTGLQAAQRIAPEVLGELLARCLRAVGRGTELAQQLMAFGRVQEVRVQTLDVTRHVLESRPLLQGALPTHTALEVKLESGLWPVTVDPTQLELALLNLVMNARDAMPDGGRIVLEVANETVVSASPEVPVGEYVRLSVTDNGEGMSDEVMARAFDPFFTTKGVGKGAGMGLPQAYGFARQSGGTLVLHSHPGDGTCATLYLPRAQAGAAAAPHAVDQPVPARGKGKVLLVEDDELVRETVSVALREAGFEIYTADNADSAWQRLEAGERFDAVLTDVVMPGRLSGLDLAQQILSRHPHTRVLVATGYSDKAVQLPGVRALPKPYDLQQAVNALNEVLSASMG